MDELNLPRVKAEVLAVLEEAQMSPGAYLAHARADQALCRLLSALGHKDVVEAWRKVDNWTY